MPVVNTSSSRSAEDQLIRVPLSRLMPHPSNSNQMSPERLEKLARNIELEGRYPPLIARSHPDLPGHYQLLDGHQRVAVLRELGYDDATVFRWECDDATALRLLATLNRLEGGDVPALRAALLAELSEFLSVEELDALLPEDAHEIEQSLSLVDFDSERLLAELTAAANPATSHGLRAATFALAEDDEEVVEQAVERAQSHLIGENKRGRALGLIFRAYLEVTNG